MKDPLSLSTLFANFGNDLATVDDKKSLLQLIAASLAPKLTISDILLSILNEDKQTHSVFIHHCDKALMEKSDHTQLSREKFRLDDGICNITMASPSPLVVDIGSILLRPDPPRYIAKWYRSSISRMIAVRLRSHGQLLGSLFLFVEKALIGLEDLEIVQHFSYMISPPLRNILSEEKIAKQQRDHETLLSLSTDLVKAGNKEDLFHLLDQRLHQLFEFDQSRIALLYQDQPASGVEDIPERAIEATLASDQPLVFDLGMKEAVMTALRKEGGNFGLLILFSRTKGWFTPRHLDSIRTLSNQFSIAFTNILTHEAILEKDNDKSLILSLGKSLLSARNKKDFLAVVEDALRNVLPYDELTISGLHADGGKQEHIYDMLRQSDTPQVYDNGMHEILAIPLRVSNQYLGGVFIYFKKKGLLTPRISSLLQGLCDQIAIGMTNLQAYEKVASQLEDIHHYKHRLEEENRYLQEQIRKADGSSEIIGSGSAMQKLFQLISIVSPSDNTVLILGEPGTGKELVAKAIHNASSRKDKFMIKVDCAALPAHLLEAELFGKFELANDSTLFLDEIGEIPPGLQARLLQAIEEKKNVRIIAATNRPLRKEVEAGRFRSDLFYRLNVFPIHLPSLRERKEDLPLLAAHFIDRQTQRFGKKITNISHRALETLMRYEWPGNVRELEHLIERSILSTTGPTIKDVPLPVDIDMDISDTASGSSLKTLDELERDHILAVLKKCNHKIGGPGGAAELLRLPATTLHSKIKKLGIK
ncbi:MAG TPA: sigma 54-interacting transcriptional regulator [Puia sp.]|nr:sigma 54-interacting transcriptional regulator [Puia sp.]